MPIVTGMHCQCEGVVEPTVDEVVRSGLEEASKRTSIAFRIVLVQHYDAHPTLLSRADFFRKTGASVSRPEQAFGEKPPAQQCSRAASGMACTCRTALAPLIRRPGCGRRRRAPAASPRRRAWQSLPPQ
eukprot:scaffold191249_cov30-Tisochrysis_lutea.AAC.4